MKYIANITIKKLAENDIPTMVYYKIPAHLQSGYKKYGYLKGDFPVSENISDRILSIPMHPYLQKNEQNIIIDCLNDLA